LFTRAAAEKPLAGWVIQCSGNWEDRTNPDQAVKLACKGDRGDLLWFQLSRDSKLVLTSHRIHQWIIVRIARTGEARRFDCDRPGECAPPPLPFASLVPKEEVPSLLSVFLGSPGTTYARVRLIISRSPSDESSRAVVDHAAIEEGTRITLRDLLRPTAAAATYLLELCPFDEKNGCPGKSKPISMNWPADSNKPWPARVDAGLYEVVLNRVVNGITIRTADRGLLLVSPPKDAATVKQKVETGEQLFLKDWKDRGEGLLMFHALLVDLASQRQ